MLLQSKRLAYILSSIPVFLLIPFVAMQFTEEVNWTFFDFLVMGILLSITGLTIELILQKVTDVKHRITLGVLVFLTLILVWAELAVGIFGTPFAGS